MADTALMMASIARRTWARDGQADQGFVAASRDGDPYALWINTHLGLIVLIPLTLWLAALHQRLGATVLVWIALIAAIEMTWVRATKRDEIPDPSIHFGIIGAASAAGVWIMPSLWAALVPTTVTSAALLAMIGRRRGAGILIVITGLMMWLAARQGPPPPIPWWTILVMSIGHLVGATGYMSSHLRSMDRKLSESLISSEAAAWEIDSDGQITNVIGAALGKLERGSDLQRSVHPDDHRPSHLAPGQVVEYRLANGENTWRWVREVADTRSSAGDQRSTVYDVTESRDARSATERLALIDQLTGLPNRAAHVDVSEEWVETERGGHMVLLDLNGFKAVNDSVGHAIGDRLLHLFAERVARVSGPTHTARLGGDEFAALVPGSRQDAVSVAHRLVDCAFDPFEIENITVTVGAAAGVASFRRQQSAEDTRRHADIALYSAKETNQRVVEHDSRHSARSHKRRQLASRLPSALASGELVVVHQPKLDIATERVEATEALIRWDHPEMGILMPDEFLPLVAVGGHLSKLTQRVIHASLADLAFVRGQGFDLHVAVNIDGRNLLEPGFAAAVLAELSWFGLDPEHLTLELTEEALVSGDGTVGATLGELSDAGLRLSVDDFGTGYSSLAYLGNLPVDEVKLDRALIAGLITNDRDRAIVDAMLRLARDLDMTVTAEGVEDRATLDLLGELGCTTAQGYLIGHPVQIADLDLADVRRHEDGEPSSGQASSLIDRSS